MRLELRGITKRFGSILANDAVTLTVEEGQIHALLGENGAGKSTLMNVVAGLYAPDAGEILLDGRPVRMRGPGEAMARGIGMVHQQFMLVPVFTVAQNVILGHEPVKGAGMIDMARARAMVREISDRFAFGVDPDAEVGSLSVGVQQRVEIVKALSRQAKILILDEPTAVLTPQETDELMGIMRELAAQGTSIVFITHKLREVREAAHAITVMRRGRVVGEASPRDTPADLAAAMVGRAVDLAVAKQGATPGDVALSVEGLTLVGPTGQALLADLTFDVRRGEILAVAGVQGNGQTELAEVLLGLRSPTAGSITVDGQMLTGRSVHDVLEAGVGFIPEDRARDGVVASLSIAENLVLDHVDTPEFSTHGALRTDQIARNAAACIEAFDIRTPSADLPVSTLSGGNQQKVVVARELSRDLRVLVASQPTRGLDVGSIEFVHRQIVAQRDAGTPVVIVSTELDEVTALADRIAVMYEGRIVGIVPGDTDRETLGLMMSGSPPDSGADVSPSVGERGAEG
jgi:simple sugar transport system ATP-binding protein